MNQEDVHDASWFLSPACFGKGGGYTMKRFFLLLIMVIMLNPSVSRGEDFLGAPLPPGGKIVYQSGSRLEKSYPLTYEEAIEFYRNALKGWEDIKFWERVREVKIEEYNVRPWHSITIEKADDGGTRITVKKDSWTWILGTLAMRFLAVFGVLVALYIPLSIVGSISARIALKKKAQKTDKK
jgi:hypothetical protein